MNTRAIGRLRSRLKEGRSTHGLWVTLESPSVTEIGVALGMDWIVIDAEHGHLDWKDIVGHLRAAVRSDTVMLVRLAEGNVGLIKRALDLGADGIIIPRVESAVQLRQIKEAAGFPPQGIRGIGAERATAWGQCFSEHVREATEHTLVIPLIESVAGIENLPDMLMVDGVDIFWFGPADLSATAGFPGQWEGPGVAEKIADGIKRVVATGKHAGIMVRDVVDLHLRQEQGVHLLGLGMDTGLIISSLRSMLSAAGKNPLLQTSFEPMDTRELVEQSKKEPLRILPEPFHPDRAEVINKPGNGPQVELAPGVHLDCLVGAHNGARNLTTGIVSIGDNATLPYHRHSNTESLTVLSGTLFFEVEGRRYQLGPLDNVTVPAGLAHQAVNQSGAGVRAHVVLASSTPDRLPATDDFQRHEMADDSIGLPGKEQVVRFKLVVPYVAGPNTQFIDYLNADLLPGIEMSGGYGLFFPGGRLPAHIHDFDESICIIQGEATCNVEGRRYQMSGCETALQPRGRVHYFINDSPKPMIMLWVYAGPRPDRIIIDEKWTAPDSRAWQES